MANAKKQIIPTQEEIEDFQNRVKIVQTEIGNLLKQNQLEMISSYDLPRYNPEFLPDEVKLALVVLNNHGLIFNSKFKDLKKVGKK